MEKDAKGRGMPNTWPSSESIGRSCGSVFASTLVKALSNPTDPLSVEENGEESSEEDDGEDDEESMTYSALAELYGTHAKIGSIGFGSTKNSRLARKMTNGCTLGLDARELLSLTLSRDGISFSFIRVLRQQTRGSRETLHLPAWISPPARVSSKPLASKTLTARSS